MKVRKGFVSNSSSSSFVIFGKAITVKDFLSNDYGHPVYCVGDYIGDGLDIFPITEEMKKELKKNPFKKDMRLIIAYQTGSSNIEVETETLPAKFSLFSFEQDYYCTETIQEFVDRYLEKEYIEPKEWDYYVCPVCEKNDWEEDSFGTPTTIIVCSNCKQVRITLEE